MKINGEHILHAPRERVWWALLDPTVLARTIPGCEALEETGPDTYRMTITAGVASIQGSYAGEVRLREQESPSSFQLLATGAGAPGTVRADVRVRLEEAAEDETRLTYDADAEVGGMIGGVGQRVLAGVARKTAREFFGNVDDVLTGRAREPVAERAAARAGRGPLLTRPGTLPVALPPDFARGAVVGGLIALAGVAIGAALGRRVWR